MKLLLLPFILLYGNNCAIPEPSAGEQSERREKKQASTERSSPSIVLRFFYDSAGNIIRKALVPPANSPVRSQEVRTEERIHEADISLRTDESWSRVQISTADGMNSGEKTLEVFNLTGIRCYTAQITSHTLTADLSALPKGIYLFVFSGNGASKTYKLHKP